MFSKLYFAVLFILSALTAVAQDPVLAFPGNYKTVLNNHTVDVIRVHYGPHEKLGPHDHSKFPTIYVYLSDSPSTRFAHDETPPFVLVRPATFKGAFRVSPGRLERHSVENLGGESSDFLRVELKNVKLGSALEPFRGHKPLNLDRTADTIEHAAREFQVERAICREQICALMTFQHPSLLIAFSPLSIRQNTADSSATPMKDGDVLWASSGSLSVLPETAMPAHLLRIILTNAE